MNYIFTISEKKGSHLDSLDLISSSEPLFCKVVIVQKTMTLYHMSYSSEVISPLSQANVCLVWPLKGDILTT